MNKKETWAFIQENATVYGADPDRIVVKIDGLNNSHTSPLREHLHARKIAPTVWEIDIYTDQPTLKDQIQTLLDNGLTVAEIMLQLNLTPEEFYGAGR